MMKLNFVTLENGIEYLVMQEVKYNDVLPEPIKAILTTIPSNREAFSKFAAARSIK